MSYDLFTTTGTDTHRRVTQDFFMRLLDNGYLYRETAEQFYDEEAERFLPDRYVEGTCPHCGFIPCQGRSMRQLRAHPGADRPHRPEEQAHREYPRCLQETEHYVWKLSEFQEPLLEWLETREGWRPHVINFAKGDGRGRAA